MNFSSVLVQITQPLGVYNILVNRILEIQPRGLCEVGKKMAEQFSQDVVNF